MVFDKRYIFNSHVVAAAAHIRRFQDKPVQLETWFEGSAALPPTGGALRSQSPGRVIQHPDHGFVMSFEAAQASITGDVIDSSLAFAQTQQQHVDRLPPVRVAGETTVSKLNIQNRLKIQHLELRTMSEDAVDERPMHFSVPSMPQIVDLEIDGKVMRLDLDDVLLKFPNKTALEEEYERSPEFRKQYHHRFFTPNGEKGGAKIPLIRNFAVASVVRALSFPNGKPDGAELLNDNTIALNNFGKIVLGELFLGDRKRRLTLVRLQLGSDWGGDASFNSSGDPGTDPMP